MKMNAVARLDRREEVFVVVDAEIGMVAALHEQAGAAECERLLDLLEDDRLRQQVALAPVSGPAVEGAEVAVGDADVRVVEVAVDDERDAARVVLAVAHRVRCTPDRDEVTRFEQRQRVGVVDPLAVVNLLQDLRGIRHATGDSAATKRSSGTVSSSPASRASSRNV